MRLVYEAKETSKPDWKINLKKAAGMWEDYDHIHKKISVKFANPPTAEFLNKKTCIFIDHLRDKKEAVQYLEDLARISHHYLDSS